MCAFRPVWLLCSLIDQKPARLLHPWESPGKKYWEGCHLLLPGNLPGPAPLAAPSQVWGCPCACVRPLGSSAFTCAGSQHPDIRISAIKSFSLTLPLSPSSFYCSGNWLHTLKRLSRLRASLHMIDLNHRSCLSMTDLLCEWLGLQVHRYACAHICLAVYMRSYRSISSCWSCSPVFKCASVLLETKANFSLNSIY